MESESRSVRAFLLGCALSLIPKPEPDSSKEDVRPVFADTLARIAGSLLAATRTIPAGLVFGAGLTLYVVNSGLIGAEKFVKRINRK